VNNGNFELAHTSQHIQKSISANKSHFVDDFESTITTEKGSIAVIDIALNETEVIAAKMPSTQDRHNIDSSETSISDRRNDSVPNKLSRPFSANDSLNLKRLSVNGSSPCNSPTQLR
jgi:hypothetical protein